MFKSKRLSALGVVAAAVLILVLLRACAWADDTEAIPVGTKITIQNWRQYKQFMSDGMVALFEGKYAFQMPNDVEIDVGAPIHVVRPSTYREATENIVDKFGWCICLTVTTMLRTMSRASHFPSLEDRTRVTKFWPMLGTDTARISASGRLIPPCGTCG